VTRFSFCLLLLAGPAAGQTTLGPERAVELALKSHPLLAAGAARVQAAAGYVVQSRLRPNPRLTLQSENWRAWSTPALDASRDTDQYAYLTQPIETAGKRARRVEVARAASGRAGAEREVLARQIALAVREAYWSAAGAAKVHALLVETARNFERIVEYHELRVKEGAMAEADLLKVQLEGQRLEVSIRNAALEAERARIELFRAMGAADQPDVRLAVLPEQVEPEPAAADAEAAVERRPEVKLARAALQQAQANVRLQEANARPDVDVLFGYKRTAGYNGWMGGVQFALPVSNRNQGSIAAAVAEARAAESDLAAVQAQARAEVRAARAGVRSRRDALTRLFGTAGGTGMLAKAHESSRIALAAYREGGGDLLRLLDTERVRIETEVQYYRTLAEYRQSVAALEAALGGGQ
jgi:outer membrane protein TolC